MITMISTDEYKDLILKEEELAKVKNELECATECLGETKQELKNLKMEFNCLLLKLTGEQAIVKWEEGKFGTYDLADRQSIIDYINENYVEDAKLKLKEIYND